MAFLVAANVSGRGAGGEILVRQPNACNKDA